MAEEQLGSAAQSALPRRGWRIAGRVQGVGFRWWCVRTGTGLGLVGNVRNDPDGTVVFCASGSDTALDQMEDKLATGPLMARVASVESCAADGPFPMAGIEVIG